MKHVVSTFLRLGMVGGLAVAVVAPSAGAHAASASGASGAATDRQSVHALARAGEDRLVFSHTETDLATGESITSSRTEAVDNRGRIVHSLEQDVTGDGTVLFSFEGTATYSSKGAATSVSVFDGDGDGPEPPTVTRSTLNYGTRGILVSADTTYDFDNDGTVDSTDHEERTQDQRGLDLTIHLERSNGPGTDDDEVIDTTYVYDKHGNVVELTEDRDLLGTPQSPDERFHATNAFDNRGGLVGGGDETYLVAPDGTPVLTSASTYSATTNAQGQRIADHAEYDVDGDGTVDRVADGTYAYDKSKHDVFRQLTSVEGGVTTVDTSTATWDNHDNPTSFVDETTVDGTRTFRRVETDFYDNRGNQTGFVISSDEDGDGVVEDINRLQFTLDARGRAVSFDGTHEDATGTVTSRRHGTIEWTRTTETDTVLRDDDNDGTWDRQEVFVFAL